MDKQITKIKMMKTYKGEKYIYLLMGYTLARSNDNYYNVGFDNGFKGGQNYERTFKIQKYNNKELLIETKSSTGCADFSRTFEVINGDFDKPIICDYLNEYFENCGQKWVH